MEIFLKFQKKINLNQNINYDQYKEISEVIDTIDFYKLAQILKILII